MQVVGISDFNLGDIIRPEPQRLRMILSGIINYMKFREDQIKILVNMDRDVVSVSFFFSNNSQIIFFIIS